MKIGIIDTDHYFYIYSLISLFGNGNNEITIYTTPKIFQRCKVDLKDRTGLRYVVQNTDEDWENFLSRNVESINASGYSYFFILPIYHQYKDHYKFIRKLKTLNILVVFNLNGWINPDFAGLRNFRKNRYKRKIMRLINTIAIDEHYHSHALKRGWKKNILHIPSILYNPDLFTGTKINNQPLKIIVPGSIDKERRDYLLVLNAIRKVLDRTKDFEVVLLGDSIGEYGKQIQDSAKLINEKAGKKIIYFYENQYNDAEFVRQIVTGHFLIAPVLPEFKLDGITEIYGISKSTGSCFDILAYAIPGIFPEWLSVNPKFNSSILRYKDENQLSEIIIGLFRDREKLNKIRDCAMENSQWYTIDKVRERILDSPVFKNKIK